MTRHRDFTIDERRRREQAMYKMPMAGRRRRWWPVPGLVLLAGGLAAWLLGG